MEAKYLLVWYNHGRERNKGDFYLNISRTPAKGTKLPGSLNIINNNDYYQTNQ